MPERAHKRQLTSTVYATPLMTPTTDLGLTIRLSMLQLRETVDWDIFRHLLVPKSSRRLDFRLIGYRTSGDWVGSSKPKKETDWDIFLGPPERARAETGGADQWVLKRRDLPGFAKVNKVIRIPGTPTISFQ